MTRGWRRQDWIRRGEDTGAKWGAQVTLPASSRSLQPSADTQPQAGGGVRGRDGKGRQRQGCRCRRPQGPALVGRGTGSGSLRARVGRSALARPRPMARGSHPGSRRVRRRVQRRSGWRTGRHSASLSLTLAHPHQRSPAEPARLRRPGVLGRILQPVQPRPGPPNRVTSRSEPSGQMSFVAAWGPITPLPTRPGRSLSGWSGPALRARLCSGLFGSSRRLLLRLLPGSRGHSARRAQSGAPSRGVPVPRS